MHARFQQPTGGVHGGGAPSNLERPAAFNTALSDFVEACCITKSWLPSRWLAERENVPDRLRLAPNTYLFPTMPHAR